MTKLRWSGECESLDAIERRRMFDRTGSSDSLVRDRTAAIVARVREGGDVALRELALELDGAVLDSLEVPRKRWIKALDSLDLSVRRAMERAADNIRRVHEAFRPSAQEFESEPGVIVGRRPDALSRVGVYAPGGRAAYPSSVLMGVLPAKVAGVSDVILCSPPSGDGGGPSAVVLAAAAIAHADRVFALGGAGAIAAMAFGTESVPRVDRIVGPGNAYVAEAKLQLSNMVGIDSPAGPSELLIIGDAAADPRVVAREMLAQAEHDPLAVVIGILVGENAVASVRLAMDELMSEQPRAEVILAALAGQGALFSARSLESAIDFANAFAPEHLLLAVESPDAVLPLVRNAGTVFLGASASVVFGDYMTGANHVLPTGGLARSFSGLSTLDFIRWTSYQRMSRGAAARLAADTGCFADSEGLPGHALAARAWAEELA